MRLPQGPSPPSSVGCEPPACSLLARRSVVRHAASLLSKVVDSLAPSITNVLVQGKQVSLPPQTHTRPRPKGFW